ncbi:hypothetical protein [Noviherbaspirillum pedocola]|uniref:Uncharacterized protein n=1 Tax=Noviherbaspirillum pedocola TaxID=2801341 RepID=A0A934SXE8_9BURK|nr:hypothetical protein [Noviherbaspirillum pedocola]MBK4737434.1 hypothetical protein [Noviherbaspirillum pedocola]
MPAIEFTQRLRAHGFKPDHAARMHGAAIAAAARALSPARLRSRKPKAMRIVGESRIAATESRQRVKENGKRKFAAAITLFMKIGYDLPNSPPQHLLPSRVNHSKPAPSMTVAGVCGNPPRYAASGMAIRTEALIPNPPQRKS